MQKKIIAYNIEIFPLIINNYNLAEKFINLFKSNHWILPYLCELTINNNIKKILIEKINNHHTSSNKEELISSTDIIYNILILFVIIKTNNLSFVTKLIKFFKHDYCILQYLYNLIDDRNIKKLIIDEINKCCYVLRKKNNKIPIRPNMNVEELLNAKNNLKSVSLLKINNKLSKPVYR